MGRSGRPGCSQTYDVAWFEEPLPPDAMDDYARLRATAAIAIAGGEVLTRRQAFPPVARGRRVRYRPAGRDEGAAGSAAVREVAGIARDHGVKLVPHGWNTAIGLAADLQLASAFADTDLVEYIAGSPYIDELRRGGWSLDADGMLDIPASPGLGLDLDLDALDRYAATPLPQPVASQLRARATA